MNPTLVETSQAETVEGLTLENAEFQLTELSQWDLILVGGGSGDVIF